MAIETLDFLNVNGVMIAVRHRHGTKMPGIVCLGGYHSDMRGKKAVHLDQWAAATEHACLRFDYSGHGESGGHFNDGTISRWLMESLTIFQHFTSGPQILIGSSMGAWITLRMVQKLRLLGNQPTGIILIAPAPDFTTILLEPQLTDKERCDLERKGYFEKLSEYSSHPYIYTQAFIEDSRRNLVLKDTIETGCPVHILQGMEDPDVPYTHALSLIEHLPLEDVILTLVRDGNHSLSRPQDLDLLIQSVSMLAHHIHAH